MKPTYDELLEIIKAQQETIVRLEKRVAELEERLNLNSKNSSKPPSTDQKRNKQKPKGGAVKGHKGHHRKLSEVVDKRIHIPIDICPECGSTDLSKRPPRIFQQHELPDIKPIVTEIECEKGRCNNCRKNFVAPLPKEYDQSAFGPRLISTISLCSSAYRMSKRSIQTMLKTLLGVDISLGSIPAMERDETSFRQEIKSRYIGTVITDQISMIRVLPTSGSDNQKEV